MQEKIKITNIISRDIKPSTQRPGTTFTVTKFLDDKNRLLETAGKAGESFQVGQEIEGEVKQTQYGLKFSPKVEGGRFAPRNYWPDAYRLALDYSTKLNMPLSIEALDNMAVRFKERIEKGPQKNQSVQAPHPATTAFDNVPLEDPFESIQ